MKKIFKNIIWFLLFILLIGNIGIFMISLMISDEINHYEKGITKLSIENRDLEKKLNEIDSLKYAASMSSKLDFIKESTPFYLDSLKYALNN